MRARERALVERYVAEAVAPAPPLPPVAGTDAVAAFAAQMAAAPRLNRLGIRVLLLAHAAGVAPGPAQEPLRALAHISYYGDLGVMRTLGYDPEAVVRRARA
jgi:hypothetical protein